MSSRRTAEEQAEIWRCKPEAVTRAIRSGSLAATKVAGRWLIEPVDAEAYEAARRNVAPAQKRQRAPRRRAA